MTYRAGTAGTGTRTPRHRQRATVASPERERARPDAPRPRVLVAEDSPTQARWLASVLARAGSEVAIARDGREAIGLVRANPPDLLLCDVDMPYADGFEVCRTIKEDPRLRAVPVVLVTQRDRVTDLVKALEVGADNYVTKPLDTLVLTSRLARILGDAQRRKTASAEQRRPSVPDGENLLTLERRQVVEMLMATAQKLEEEVGTAGEIGVAITTSRSLDDVLIEIVDRVRSLSGADLVTLATRNDNGTWQVRTAGAASDAVASQARREPVTDATFPISVDELRQRRPFHVRASDETTSRSLREIAARYEIVDIYGWPLVVGDELIGTLGVSFKDRRSFTADEHRRYRQLADQAAVAIVNSRLFEQERTLRLQLEKALAAEREANKNAMFMLAAAVEAKDGLTGAHLRRVQAYVEALATELGLSETTVEEIGYSSVLHDVGKLLVPERILGKPGGLSDDEWVEMRKHPEHGAAILMDQPFFAMASDIARCHHERWDGTGYPRGLKGEDIPLAARITSVADVFDALVTKRSYKEAWSDTDAIAEIRRLSGASFDPTVVNAFVRLWTRDEIQRIRAELASQLR
jgi:response regulator RpfG family c-di-GMP phosphodiesterase